MPPVGFEPTISAGERPQTYALDCAATGTGNKYQYWKLKLNSALNNINQFHKTSSNEHKQV